ncbi:MAG: hypothetical protein U5J99_09840 [Parvularculaceae bacterium]|nr:hypothetical protein [Parvularculaceae bacterium]
MLRILLIILVALAVIIGLMRLTGSKPGDVAPAAATGEAVEEAAEAALPAEEVIIDEPAVDALGAPVDIGAGIDPMEEIPAEMAPASPGDAPPVPGPDAGPATDPAPAVEEPLADPVPDAAAPDAAPDGSGR